MSSRGFASVSVSVILIGGVAADAQVSFSGNFATGSGQIAFSRDITFTLSSSLGSGNPFSLVFDEAVTADAGRSGANIKQGSSVGIQTGGISYTRDAVLYDNRATTQNNLTAKDTYLSISGLALSRSPGDTLTIRSGTWLFDPVSNFNPALSSLQFTGNLFLVNQNGVRISGNVSAVPEPRDYALATGLGLAAWGAWRARRARGTAMGSRLNC